MPAKAPNTAHPHPLPLRELRRLAAASSRTLALSLRLLPTPLERPATLAALLARLSDTIADAPPTDTPHPTYPQPPLHARLALLIQLRSHPLLVSPATPGFPWAAATPGELALWRAWPQLLTELEHSPFRPLILATWHRILEAQTFDLHRTLAHTASIPLPWSTLLLYADGVAGSVGRFWHQLGTTACPPWSTAPPSFLTHAPTSAGIALQLLNICRDTTTDSSTLRRRYLAPRDHPRALASIRQGLSLGEAYARSLLPFRARLATLLPFRLARHLLPALKTGHTARLTRPIVRAETLRTLLAALPPARTPRQPLTPSKHPQNTTAQAPDSHHKDFSRAATPTPS